MCMMVYIGSDNELPLIDRWGNNTSPIYIWELDCSYDDDDFANNALVKKYKYGVGSWQGCACGFAFDYSDQFNELPWFLRVLTSKEEKKEHIENIKENNDLGKQSFESLFEYICVYVANDNCELLSFWTDNFEIKDRSIIDLKAFSLGDSFKFSDGQYITVSK